MNHGASAIVRAGKRSPIDALLDSFTVNTLRIHTLMGYPGVLLLLAVLLAGLIVAPGVNRDDRLVYLAIAALIGSVLTYLAEWYYNLQMAKAKADMLRSYQKMLIEKFLPQDVRLQDVQAVIRDIISPMLGLERDKEPPGP
jgi:hypothetical protein